MSRTEAEMRRAMEAARAAGATRVDLPMMGDSMADDDLFARLADECGMLTFSLEYPCRANGFAPFAATGVVWRASK